MHVFPTNTATKHSSSNRMIRTIGGAVFESSPFGTEVHDRSFQVQLIISFDISFLDVLIYIGIHQRALGTHSYNCVRSNSIIGCYRQLINDAVDNLRTY